MNDTTKGFLMKKVATVALIAFAVTLAVIIGQRMSTDAMAVVIGVACGVLASIPTSLLILAVSGRQGGRREREVRQQRNYPPVVIVNPGNNQPRYLQPPYSAPLTKGRSVSSGLSVRRMWCWTRGGTSRTGCDVP